MGNESDPQQQTLSYRLGRFVRLHPFVTVAIVAAVFGAWHFSQEGAEQQRIADASAKQAAAEQTERARLVEVARAEAVLKEECATNGKAHKEAMEEAARGDVQAAFRAVMYCREHLDANPPVKALYIKVADAARKQDAADAARAAAIVKAAKRREGVKIGMTQQDVLDSSWGKPDTINRTTSASGTREQWVYRSRVSGYLYFENGVLTTVQH